VKEVQSCLLKGPAFFMDIFVTVPPLRVCQLGNVLEDFGEQSLRAFGRAQRVEMLSELGEPLIGGEALHKVPPSNRVLGLDQSQKNRRPRGVIHQGQVPPPGGEAINNGRSKAGTTLGVSPSSALASRPTSSNSSAAGSPTL
jgi:hypothetical protein